jgi:phosphatidylglycerophosphate synthase
MPAPAVQLVIDARPRGPRGPLASELLLGEPVLHHLLEQAVAIGPIDRPIAIYAREDEHPLMMGLAVDSAPGRFVLHAGPPLLGAAILRTDRLYDTGRLRRAVRRGRNPETAVIWRLDRTLSLSAAEEELTRRLSYQPVGRYWAFLLAERIAASFASTSVRPNALTLSAGALMFAAAALVACGSVSVWARLATALAMAFALVLDTADGRLARLQGTSSPFGRWLDQVVDELADLILHAAVAWSMFQATGRPAWLVVGLLYASGKYIFVFQAQAGLEMEEEMEGARRSSRAGTLPAAVPWIRWGFRSLGAMLGHADLRWHLWIALAAIGRLDLALAAYAAYFPLRALAGGVRKAVAHA